jgi:hypothetical protein
MQDKPGDVETEAAQLRDSAARAAACILARRAALDREGRHNEPLIVLAGEFHSESAHNIHHRLVLQALRAREPVAFAYEEQHSLLDLETRHVLKRAPGRALADRLRAADRNGALSIRAALGAYCSIDFRQTGFTVLFRYLLGNDIPTRFTDVSRPREDLDMDDPSTAASLRACFGDAAAPLDALSPRGMRARNHHMAARVLDFARETKARIVFQQCGDAHVAGDDMMGWPARHSLSVHLKARGAAILAMPILSPHFGADDLPPAHGLLPHELHLVAPLPDAGHFEGARVNGWLKALGLPGERLSIEAYSRCAASLKTALAGF